MKYLYLILSITCSAYAGELRPMDSPHFIVIVREFTLNLDEEDNKNEQPDLPIKSEVSPKKLSFKEKFEFESLEKEMPQLLTEKKELEEKISQPLPFEELQKLSERISQIIHQLDEKEMRWLELSEKA